MNSDIKTNQIERFELLLKELNISIPKLSSELGYASTTSLYRVQKGENKLSEKPLVDRILKRYPFINIDFLINGELPVKLTPEEQIIQNNLIQATKYPTLSEHALDNINQNIILILKEIKELRKEIKEIKEQQKKQ